MNSKYCIVRLQIKLYSTRSIISFYKYSTLYCINLRAMLFKGLEVNSILFCSVSNGGSIERALSIAKSPSVLSRLPLPLETPQFHCRFKL